MSVTELGVRAEQQLRAQRNALLEDLRARLHASGEPEQMALLNHLETTGDWVEADVFAEQDLAMLQHELAHLREIDQALARVKSATFGTCLECGEPISAERLQVQPTAQFCLPCQQELEERRARLHIR